MKVIITIPAYNEEKTIGVVIENIKKAMDKSKYNYEIIVVDDGSTDNTYNEAKKAGAVVFSHPYNYGLAETFRTEMEKCIEKKADIIVHIDADGQYRAEEIHNLIKPILNKEADIVLGSRFAGKIESMPMIKKLGNRAFSKVISYITRVRITDSQTGFRAFTREAAEKIKITSTYTYTQEMIIRAIKNKLRIRETPIHFDRRKEGRSRLLSNPFEYASKAWINLLRLFRDYAPLKFFGFIGSGLLAISGLWGVYLLYLFVYGGYSISEKVPSLILMLLLFVTGLQTLIFGFLADMKQNS